jgi:hypothetical protein
VFWAVAVALNWIRLEWSFETIGAVLVGYGLWIGAVYSLAKLLRETPLRLRFCVR